MQYQKNRANPHIYDDDELAGDFLNAIKKDPWLTSFKQGINLVEAKLDRWKNSVGDPFPEDLKLNLIGHTLMTPYVESNIDPLQSVRPTVRTLQNRGRSCSNSRSRQSNNRRESRSRSASNSSR